MPQQRLLSASQEFAICPDLGLRANGMSSHTSLVNGTQAPTQSSSQDVEEGSGIGDVMPEIENFQEGAEHCFELAKRSDFLQEDMALVAFELLTASNYDRILAHALGVSL